MLHKVREKDGEAVEVSALAVSTVDLHNSQVESNSNLLSIVMPYR